MQWELTFIQWANQWWSSSLLDSLVPWFTYLGSHFAIILFILLSFIMTKQRKVFRSLLLLYGIQSAVIYSLKYLIQRERPISILEMADRLSKGPGEILDPSFPSAHAAYAFMMATVLSTWFPCQRILFYLLAAIIAWSRVYLGLHFPSDVMIGACLGYGITKAYLKVLKEIEIRKSHLKRGN